MASLDKMYQRYLEIGDVTKTAKQFHIDNKRLFRLFRENGLALIISERKRSSVYNNFRGQWSRGVARYIDKDGYVRIRAPGHSEATTNGWALEHRVIMADHLGRALADSEHVHHRNGNKADNTIENLELVNCHIHPDRHYRATLSLEHKARIVAALRPYWDSKHKPCKEQGCERTASSRGLCHKHYCRIWRVHRRGLPASF